jgi:hypothetical protein
LGMCLSMWFDVDWMNIDVYSCVIDRLTWEKLYLYELIELLLWKMGFMINVYKFPKLSYVKCFWS